MCLQFAITGDIIPADSPLMSGQGVFSSCQGDFDEIFAEVKEYAQSFDFLIGNFEAVLVEKIARVTPGASAMKAPISVLPALRQCRFGYMSIANNHTMEYGTSSFNWTCEQLHAAGIETFGHKTKPWLIIDTEKKQGKKIGLIAFSTVPAMYGHLPEYYFLDKKSSVEITNLLGHIEEAKKKCDWLLAFPHWGNEFMTEPAAWQIELAEKMLVAGVDGIFGAHPHVIQSACLLKNKPVFFSLGNLLSDYIQDEYKKNIVVAVKLTNNLIDTSAEIFTCNDDFIISNTGEKLPMAESLAPTLSADEYANKANKTRHQVRNELIIHLLKKPHRWCFNFGLWKWLLLRCLYIVCNHKKIKRDPNHIYSGPIH